MVCLRLHNYYMQKEISGTQKIASLCLYLGGGIFIYMYFLLFKRDVCVAYFSPISIYYFYNNFTE